METVSHTFYKKVRPILNIILISLAIILPQLGCKKLVEIGPPTQSIVESSVFTSDYTAIAVLTDIYAYMSRSGVFTGSGGIPVITGLSSDELVLHGGITNARFIAHYQNDLRQERGLTVTNAGAEYWSIFYNYVYKCNAAIEGLNSENAASLIPAVRKQLTGEAYFLRSFLYFNLVNIFGEVPLATSTDYTINLLLPKSSTKEIYRLIIEDLKKSQQLLSNNYLSTDLISSSTERVRPTKWVADALLARVYLYNEEYANSEIEASKILNNTPLFGLGSLTSIFLKNSQEAIWQLQPTNLYFNTEDARTFVIPPTGPSNTSSASPANPVYLSDQLLSSFEANDQRAVPGNYIDSTIYKVSATVTDTVYYPYKYKKNTRDTSIKTIASISEYLMVFRLTEQFLIRAEARAKQNNISGAQADLNAIRKRAGLGNTPAADKESLLYAILHERQVELFAEWGHRWFDLKRTGQINSVMNIATPLKGGSWETTDQLYPIPIDDILKSPNLVQNPGY
ncbi:MAG: RagB/SusD family nutrient uptake outer membrane protein [Chitinophagaceae bacterium]|nr:RagB/SusD family nutrient uptake outer membrane protein [Chitinophagaceae bacterium]